MGRGVLQGVNDGEWAVFAQKVVEERDAALERAAEAEKARDDLAALLAKLFDWPDKSYIHAVMHAENAVHNLRADLATAERFHEVAVKERDLERATLDALREKLTCPWHVEGTHYCEPCGRHFP